ncbi:MAG: hypothetical protein Q9168_002469 [Polycauliona sp. 1 TL-2023]
MSQNTHISGSLKGDYGLGRGYAPSLRLNFQHHTLRQLLGYTVHPTIKSMGQLPSKPIIADVGAGTGQWLIDLSRELPTAQLDGFDISEDQFPSKQWLPPQMSLAKLDIKQPIPSELRGKYHVVHVQLFLCVVGKHEMELVLGNLKDMLKPGGYLQWVEYDPTTFKVISIDSSLKQTANEKHVSIIRGPGGVTTTRWPFFSKPSRRGLQGVPVWGHYDGKPDCGGGEKARGIVSKSEMSCVVDHVFAELAHSSGSKHPSGLKSRRSHCKVSMAIDAAQLIELQPDRTLSLDYGDEQ